MNIENGVTYQKESEATEKIVNVNEVTENLQRGGVVVGNTDSQLARSSAELDENSLNIDEVMKGLKGITIVTERDDIDNLDQDPHVAHFLESQKAA